MLYTLVAASRLACAFLAARVATATTFFFDYTTCFFLSTKSKALNKSSTAVICYFYT
jgi:hypothetical protein